MISISHSASFSVLSLQARLLFRFLSFHCSSLTVVPCICFPAIVLRFNIFHLNHFSCSPFPATGGVSGSPEISDQGAEGRPPAEEAGHAGVLRGERPHGRAALAEAASVTAAAGQGGGDGGGDAEDRVHAPGHPQNGEGPQGGE